jgi:anti-sigma B factor antagonist
MNVDGMNVDGQFAASVAADGDGTAIVSARGELDAYAAAPFSDTLVRLAQDGAFSRIVLDFSDVTFLDSSGLRVLLGAARLASERGGRLMLVASDLRVVKVVRLTGTAGVLDLRPTLAEVLDGGGP